MKRLLTILCCIFAAALMPAGAFTIHLMGDSTMAPKNLTGGNPERGWGMMFPNFLDDSVSVINYAQNGRSTKSFIDLGLFEKVKSNLRSGDYVFIQFGHNDAKQSDTNRYAAPWGAYQDNLRYFITTVKEAGATPVLLTPVSRRWFKQGTLDLQCHGDYPAAMKQVAQETGTTLLDMTTASQKWLASIGDEASRPYYMIMYKDDNTHTNARGARKLASLTCEEIRKSDLKQIKAHLLNSPAEIVVAQDGTGDYITIQEAINACPDYDHGHFTTIHIKAGIYKEMVTIPHNKFRLHISGDGADKTIITYDKYARKLWPDTDRTMGTSGSATMYIHSSYVTLEDLTVENSAGEGKEIGQAVALFTDGDFLFFHRCRFIGNQDTIYTYGRYGKDGGVKRNYFLDCYIEGTTDFIFGPSIAYFENCRIHSKKNSYITAASTFQGQPYGYVFKNCSLTADPSVTKCYLGRPWGAYAKTVFLDCELGSHILPEGWHNWEKPGKPNTEKNSYYAEWHSHGPGAASKKERVKWSYQLTDKQAGAYTFEKVMYQEQDGIIWEPYEERFSEKMVRSEMSRNPEASYIDGLHGTLKFNYTTGLELKSFLDVYKAYGDTAVLQYVDNWYNEIITPEGKIRSYKVENYTVDRVAPSRTLLELYAYMPKDKYKAAMDLVRTQYETHPRTSEGCFWHKKVYPHQIWLDGLYMAQPFYAMYTAAFTPQQDKTKYYEDICNCFIIAARHTFDPATGLYRHAWDEFRSMFWCNPQTGQSDHCWGRALGWYAMALTDVLEVMPANVQGRDSLVTILNGICNTLPQYADKKTGMWWQVLDCPEKEGNYVEATCSAMFIYTYLKASRLGFIDAKWTSYGKKAYKDYVQTFVKTNPDGTISITDCCAVAGLGGKDNRRGDYNYYIKEKRIDNDPKGVGPFILAALEYEKK